MPTQPTTQLPPWMLQNGTLSREQSAVLRGLSVEVAVPCYAGNIQVSCAKAIAEFLRACDKTGIDVFWSALYNESLIQRARNTLAARFEQGKRDYLMFIDADIMFNPQQLLEMLLCCVYTKTTLLGGNYPMKQLDLAKAKEALDAGVQPKFLAHCCGLNVVRGDFKNVNVLAPYKLEYLATGFMLIHKSVFAAIAAANPDLWHRNNGFALPLDHKVYTYFDCKTRPDKIYISEDYYFCELANSVGHSPYLAPWVELLHIGTYNFEGCLFCSNGAIIHDIKTK